MSMSLSSLTLAGGRLTYHPSEDVTRAAHNAYRLIDEYYPVEESVRDYKNRDQSDQIASRLDVGADPIARALDAAIDALSSDLKAAGLDLVEQTKDLYSSNSGAYAVDYRQQNRLDVLNSLAAILNRPPVGFGEDLRTEIILQRLVLGQKICEYSAHQQAQKVEKLQDAGRIIKLPVKPERSSKYINNIKPPSF